MTSGGVANINANMAGGDFVGITSTISTFVFKIIGQPGLKDPSQLKGKKVSISRLGGASDFSLRYALDRWGLVPDKDVGILQVGGEEIGGQSELGIVGLRDHVVDGVEAEQRRDRAEGLLARHPHGAVDAGEDRRLEERAFAGEALVAGNHLRAL